MPKSSRPHKIECDKKKKKKSAAGLLHSSSNAIRVVVPPEKNRLVGCMYSLNVFTSLSCVETIVMYAFGVELT